MDWTIVSGKALEYGLLIGLLVWAVRQLVRRQDRMDSERKEQARLDAAERKEREERAGQECKIQIATLVSEIHQLQDSRYQDAKVLLRESMACLRQNADAFGQLVQMEKQARTDSGTHNALGG